MVAWTLLSVWHSGNYREMVEAEPPEESSTNEASAAAIEPWLRRLASRMPGSVKFRLLNTLEHFDRASQLFDLDREIASFRAITGEEEAATALIKSIQLRRYAHAREFNPRDHQHKAAVIACVMAIASELSPILKEFQLTFDFEKRRIDIKIPLTNFNIHGGADFAIELVEPLNFTHTATQESELEFFSQALEKLAARSNFENIRKMVAAQANARNTLLYASDSAVPRSVASREAIDVRKKRALTLLVLTVMVLQARKHHAFVGQAISAFLAVIARLPPTD